jgi:hypothetical protein
MPPNEEELANRWLKLRGRVRDGFAWRGAPKVLKKWLIADDNFNFRNIAFYFLSGSDLD